MTMQRNARGLAAGFYEAPTLARGIYAFGDRTYEPEASIAQLRRQGVNAIGTTKFTGTTPDGKVRCEWRVWDSRHPLG
ncbi:MAG TPA: hypothetical protein VEW42_03080 [Candidatus Eisenbacteria bacterium]|nr:hypothetical protein [Candidatus Eisenbacteria bacterium]